MKKIIGIMLLLVVLLSVSCGDDTKSAPVVKPQPQPETPKSYTILYYGSGGGLDDFMEWMIRDVAQVSDIPKSINIVGQVKWSERHYSENSDGKGGVSRFKYNHKNRVVNYSKYAGPGKRIDDAENLAEFIQWARETAPADEYIIFFFGHGNGYHPAFDGVTRGILRDDMYTSYLGIEAMREAFEMTDAKFSLMVMVCCLMNTLEYITELEPYTDYYYASNHAVLATSSELPLIVEGLVLNNGEQDAVLNASRYAIEELYDLLNLGFTDNISLDASITRCSSIENLNSEIRNFVDILVQLYAEEAEVGCEVMQQKYGFTTQNIDEALGDSYYLLASSLDYYRQEIADLEWYRRAYTYDIVSIVNMVSGRVNHAELKMCAQRVELAATEAQVYQRLYSSDMVYYSVSLVNSGEWSELGFEEANYEGLAFDKVTGWSRLLKLNNATFPHAQ